MKRLCVTLAILSLAVSAVSAQEADPIAEARADALMDARSYRATGWGAMAFGATVLVGPLLGGGGVIVAAYVMEPVVDIPIARVASARETFADSSDVYLYQQQYQESMEEPMQKDRSRRAWIGTGIGFGVNLAVFTLLVAASL